MDNCKWGTHAFYVGVIGIMILVVICQYFSPNSNDSVEIANTTTVASVENTKDSRTVIDKCDNFTVGIANGHEWYCRIKKERVLGFRSENDGFLHFYRWHDGKGWERFKKMPTEPDGLAVVYDKAIEYLKYHEYRNTKQKGN